MKAFSGLLLCLLPWSSSGQNPPGARECPCLTNLSRGFDVAVSIVTSGNRSKTHGLKGCKAYNDEECDRLPLTCNQPWCYVDMTICNVNRTLCEADDAAVGSYGSPYCRPRPVYESRYVDNGSLFFSYETCGALGSYNETRFSKGLAGIEIQAAIDRRDKYPNRVLRKLMTAAVHKFLFVKNSNRSNSKVPPELRDAFKDQSNWCTAESQARYNSSSCYSACAHDVALGKVDICVADIWITPSRSAIVQFLPPVRFDLFYLVEPSQPRTPWKWPDVMARPFKPFTAEAWLAIIGFGAAVCILRLVGHHFEPPPSGDGGQRQPRSAGQARQGEQSPPAPPEAARAGPPGTWDQIRRLSRTGSKLTHELFVGQSPLTRNNSSTVCQFISCGFAWCLLVLTSTYTANLADILATERKNVTTLKSLEEATGIKICADEEVVPFFNATKTDVTWIPASDSQEIPRKLEKGDCQAAIMYQSAIDSMHAGIYAGKNKKAEVHDCSVVRVSEEVYLTLAAGFPVTDRLAHGMSWALTSVMQSGLASTEEIKHKKKANDCRSTKPDIKQLNAADILGTLMDAGIIIMAPALVFVVCRVLESCCADKNTGDAAGGAIANADGQPAEAAEPTLEPVAPSAPPSRQSQPDSPAAAFIGQSQPDSPAAGLLLSPE